MLQIFFIRHGETVFNVEKRIQGHSPTPLNAKGIKQAKDVASFFKNKQVDKLYTSHLVRACQTAAELEKVVGKKAILAKDWAERSEGFLEGLTEEELLQKHPTVRDEWRIQGFNWKPEGGESINELFVRVKRGFEELVRSNEGTIIVVSHGGPIRALRMLLVGENQSNFFEAKHFKNGEMLEVLWDGTKAVVRESS